MTSHDRSETIRMLFAEVCDLDAEERSRVLLERCAADPDLRDEIQRLLELDTTDDWLGERDLQGLHAVLHGAGSDEGESTGEKLGPFTLEGVLGEGGMGVVYRAREAHPPRTVALKVLPPAATSEAAARFAREASTLARLQHPGIAPIFSAGTFESHGAQRPYLAMELVEGVDLGQWRQREPPLRQRIELLIEICHAVHHAHQKGVIHRDLKPTNILVDGTDHPKVVDFGIARLVEDEEHATTQTGQVLGTIAYMSPEQAEGRIQDIDTRTDVYALGVLGYELLADALPIDVRGEPIARAIRRVVEDDPVPLGTRKPSLRGDLQKIVSCCLRKVPEERYTSAMALAEDLARHLAHEPVLAREPSTLYVLGRFARRHRWLLVSVSLVFLSLTIALWISLVAMAGERTARESESKAHEQTRLAKTAAEAAASTSRRELRIRNATLEFLADTFEKTDPRVNPKARTMKPGEIFAQAVEDLDLVIREDPAVEKSIRLEVGLLLVGFSDYDLAIEQLERARTIDASIDPWKDLMIEQQFGQALSSIGRALEAVEVLTQAIEHARALVAAGVPVPSNQSTFVETLGHSLGQAYEKTGNRREAEHIWSELLAEMEARPDLRDSIALANVRSSLATIYISDGRHDRAETLIQQALETLVARRGGMAEPTLIALNNLAGIRFNRGELEQALTLHREALERAREVFGDDHRHVFDFTQNLAVAEWRAGEKDRALATLRRLIRDAEQAGSADTPVVCAPLANLGKMLWETGKLDDAATCYERAIAIREASSPEADLPFSGFYNDLARIRKDQGRADDHLRLLRRSVEIRIAAVGPLHPKVLPRRVDLAAAELYTGSQDAALEHLLAIDEHLVPTLGIHHFASTYSQQLLLECMLAQGDRERARTYLDRFEERAARERDPARWQPAIQHFRKQLAQ
ncbi:MAG: tetratricopeptide repeat protein [Planctomycetes bacterium]|nr:tetratricopeptide repeat protein [Planctomycetota bacterium]